MDDGQQQLKQHNQKQYFDQEDIILKLQQQLKSQKFQDEKSFSKQSISELHINYQQFVTYLTNTGKSSNKKQTLSTNDKNVEDTIFADLWEQHKFQPSKFIASLTSNSIKYEPYSKPIFSQTFFIEKASLNGSFLTVNVNVSIFVMKLYIFIETNFVISEQIFQNWQTKQLNYLDSGSFSDIYEYYDKQKKENIIIKKIKYSKISQVSIQTVIYEYAYLKLAAALGIGLEMKTIFGFDLLIRNHDMFFGMQFGSKSSQRLTDIKKLSENILSSLIMLHSLNIVHCDIRPQNIEYSERLKKYVLIDYGLSQCLDQQLKFKSLVSNFKGTYHYSSPQMQRLFFSQNKYVDMYFNDIYCLKKTIDEEMSNLQIKLNLNLIRQEKQSSFNLDTYSLKQDKYIDNNYFYLKQQKNTNPLISITKVLQTIFSIYRKNTLEIQKYIQKLDYQQILLVIKTFFDLDTEGQYNEISELFLNLMKNKNFAFSLIQNEMNNILKTKSLKTDTQTQGMSFLIHQFQKSHFYFQGRSYLKQLWNFYEFNVLKDFVDFQKKQKSKINQTNQQQKNQKIYRQVIKRKYKAKEIRTTKIAWIFFMFLKQKQKYQSNSRVQIILILQFCLHYCQILLIMSKRIFLNCKRYRQTTQNFNGLNSVDKDLSQQQYQAIKLIKYFNQVQNISRQLVELNQGINQYFFNLKSNKKSQVSEEFLQKDGLFWCQTCQQVPLITQMTIKSLLKRLKPSEVQMNENQQEISIKVNNIFNILLQKFIQLTSWQILFNLQQNFDSSVQSQNTNKKAQNQQSKIPKEKKIKFHLIFTKRPQHDLLVITLIIFILAKVFYQSSSYSFQQKYNLTRFVVKNYIKVIISLIKSHYLSTTKFQQNKSFLKVQNNNEYINFGIFRKIQQKIIQSVEYFFESYSLVLDFMIEQELLNINCNIGRHQKIKIYQQFKAFYQLLCKNTRFYQILKKNHQNEPVLIFIEKENQQIFQSYSSESIQMLDSYYQKNIPAKSFLNQDYQTERNFPICLLKFYKLRFLIICQQISLYLESLCLKIKTILKFPVEQQQFYDLFLKIERYQNYERQQQQKICVLLRYADYLFEKENIFQAIQILEKLNECFSQNELIQVKGAFFKNQLSIENTENIKIKKQFNQKIRRKRPSFNYLVIQQNLVRLYRFMKSDKIKNINFPAISNLKIKKEKQKIIIVGKLNEKPQNQENLSLKQKIRQLNELKMLFSQDLNKIVKTLILNSQNKEFNKNSLQSLIQNQLQKIENQLSKIIQKLHKLKFYFEQNNEISQKSSIRPFIEQSFNFLTFLQHNTETVMEKRWTILCRIQKKFNQTPIINKLRSGQDFCLKNLIKLMFGKYQTQSKNFVEQIIYINRFCSLEGNDSKQKNEAFRWDGLKNIIERKYQLLRKVYLTVCEESQNQVKISHINIQQDQNEYQSMKYNIDHFYYYLKYSFLGSIQNDQTFPLILSIQWQINHEKIVNYLLSNKIHAILSSKREYLIFSYYVKLKIRSLHHYDHFKLKDQINKTLCQLNETQLIHQYSTLYVLVLIISKLSDFIQSIQSFQFTQIFFKFVSNISSTNKFSTFALQLINFILKKQNSSIQAFQCSKFTEQMNLIYNLVISSKKNVIFMTFCIQSLLNCIDFHDIILDSVNLKTKKTQKQMKIMNTFSRFMKYFAYLLQYRFNSSHQKLKKYLIQKRQVRKYFIIVNLYQKLFQLPQTNNQSQSNEQMKSPIKSKGYKRIIINSFRKIRKNNINLEIQQKFMLNPKNFYISNQNLKLFSSKISKKYKQWNLINNPY